MTPKPKRHLRLLHFESALLKMAADCKLFLKLKRQLQLQLLLLGHAVCALW
jgi:hypothetical protein